SSLGRAADFRAKSHRDVHARQRIALEFCDHAVSHAPRSRRTQCSVQLRWTFDILHHALDARYSMKGVRKATTAVAELKITGTDKQSFAFGDEHDGRRCRRRDVGRFAAIRALAWQANGHHRAM